METSSGSYNPHAAAQTLKSHKSPLSNCKKLFEDTLDFSKIEVQMFTKIAIILFILTLMYEIIYFVFKI